MRILKYLLLLILLLFIGLSVFVSTQKANFEITRSKLIKTPKATIFNYVNDYRNWETFGSWIIEDNNIQFIYPGLTSGKGAYCSWKGNDSDGNLKTLFVKENDSISQKMFINGEDSEISWKFKDSIGGTKVTIRSKGKLDFKSKILAIFNGGINNTVSDTYEKSLEYLNKTLDYEINTHSIKVNGVVNRLGGFYLKQSVVCREKSVSKNLKIMIPKLKKFFEKNNIVMNGKPFIIYDKYDKTNDLIALSVCIPVKDSLHFTSGSDIEWVNMKPYTAVKTTLTGDYLHTQKAWVLSNTYIEKNNLVKNNSQQIIEVYIKGIEEIKQPSKWITEIYVPVFPKIVPKKPVYKTTSDSTNVASPSIP
ncbi:GyrI-like domain-containing protein [Flavobacterium sp.]|uniref:GyrI-like domain-containing protein n=1 Tax=Flavobacterium sp. TaxID=239 RepID=UPI003753ABF7